MATRPALRPPDWATYPSPRVRGVTAGHGESRPRARGRGVPLPPGQLSSDEDRCRSIVRSTGGRKASPQRADGTRALESDPRRIGRHHNGLGPVCISSAFVPAWEGGTFWNVLLTPMLPARARPAFLPRHSKGQTPGNSRGRLVRPRAERRDRFLPTWRRYRPGSGSQRGTRLAGSRQPRGHGRPVSPSRAPCPSLEMMERGSGGRGGGTRWAWPRLSLDPDWSSETPLSRGIGSPGNHPSPQALCAPAGCSGMIGLVGGARRWCALPGRRAVPKGPPSLYSTPASL